MWKRFIRHIKRWNKWRKRNLNGRLHKFLTLILGDEYSLTFATTLTDEEENELHNSLQKTILKRGQTIDI